MIVHIVHTLSVAAPLLALRVGQTFIYTVSNDSPTIVHKTTLANKCLTVLQSVKKSVTLEARFGEKGKLQ
jgi:hypothetical protein